MTKAIDYTFSQQAFETLPLVFQLRLKTIDRVILVANNPSIRPSTIASLVRPTDAFIHFNHFIHPEFFTTHRLVKSLPKLLFFRQIGDSCLHFGLPPRHNNLPQIEEMLNHADVGFLFSNISYQFPTLKDDPSPNDDPIDDQVQLIVPESLQTIISSSTHSGVLSDCHPIVADYPIIEGIHSSSPSSGFLMYRYMLAICHYLKATYNHNLDIVLLGFNTDKKTDYFWHGHNWAYERDEMTNLPEGVTLFKQS